jgi:lysophospholipase L1-like esterase
MKKVLGVLVCCVLFATQAFAAWEKEMAAFKKMDEENPPQAGLTLFVGSSTFTVWKSMQEDMPDIPLINRGFGGSQVTDLIEHFDTVIAPYNPKQIVIYEGDNDLASSKTPELVLSNYKKLLERIREQYAQVPVTVVSVKPSEARRDVIGKMNELNQKLNVWASLTENLYYLNTFDITVNGEGKPIPEYYQKDNLHLNQAGYKAWARKIAEHIKKVDQLTK